MICTYGGSANYKSIEQILDKKRSKVIGKFGCKGYDTFGPFKLVGGIAKGHPDEEDIKNAKKYMTSGIESIQDEQDSEITYYLGQELSQKLTTFKEYAQKIEEVTAEDVKEKYAI